MINSNRQVSESRILALTPRIKDASLTESVLVGAGIACLCCLTIEHLCEEMDDGVSAILLPEEAVMGSGGEHLEALLHNQPTWSDIPLLVLARPGADSAAVAQAMDRLGNVTVLERPMRISALVSAIRSAQKARQRQYQIRDHLLQREQAEAKLRADDQRKDEFLATLAHELRNPLAPIRNCLHILSLSKSLGSEEERMREMIERQVNHMVRLVDDLLEVSRITRGKIELRKEITSIASIIENAVETSQPHIDAQRHILTVNIPKEELLVEGDPVRLAQVFSNLLNNAAKYTEAQGQINLDVRGREEQIEISVSDNGTGILPEMLPAVFEMFAQIDRSLQKSQGGLGIGLTLVKSLVEMHGGSVDAHSDGVGLGSNFVVTLPRAVIKTGKEVTQGDDAISITQHRILVVDDNRDAAKTLGMLMQLLGSHVHTVFSGEEALEIIESYQPSVVLLDIGMPTMSGHEVARKIRSNPALDSVILIALTGWGQLEDRRLSQDAGFDHHFVKPVEIAVLEKLLSSVPPRAHSVPA